MATAIKKAAKRTATAIKKVAKKTTAKKTKKAVVKKTTKKVVAKKNVKVTTVKKTAAKTATPKKENAKVVREKTQIFSYKGFIGIDPGSKLVNDPTKPGELGCVADIKDVEIDKGAYNLLQKLKKVGGSFASIMCFETNDGGACFGWMGYRMAFKIDDVEGDRDYKPTLLKSQITEIEIPQEFKDAIDKLK